MKIAVIGSGISGLSAAYYLSKKHKVDLFEQDDHFGGHSYTYDIKEDNKVTPVDLGFIVFNELTYPNLIKFFQELDVPFEKSNMSFAVSIKNTNKLTVMGEVKKCIRVDNNSSYTYRDIIEMAGLKTFNSDLSNIKFLNSSSISSLYGKEKNRIANIDPKYRSDTDESYLSARSKTLNGIIYITNEERLSNFLNQNPIDGDILIIPSVNNWIEILGGVDSPGTYSFEQNKQVFDYILNAGGFSEASKDIYVLDVNSGTRKQINKYYIPRPGDIIFVEEKVGFKRWDRVKDIISISASISSVLLVLNNVVGNN